MKPYYFQNLTKVINNCKSFFESKKKSFLDNFNIENLSCFHNDDREEKQMKCFKMLCNKYAPVTELINKKIKDCNNIFFNI